MKLTVTLFMALIIVSGQARTACPVELGDSHASVKALGLDGLMAANRVIANTTDTDEVVPFEEFPSRRQLRWICSTFKTSYTSGKSSYNQLLITLGKIINRNNYKVTAEQVINLKYKELRCTQSFDNTLRSEASLFKFAIDFRDYDFIYDSIGVVGCSKSLSYDFDEEVDNKSESIVDFINLVLKEDEEGVKHTVPELLKLRERILLCRKKKGLI